MVTLILVLTKITPGFYRPKFDLFLYPPSTSILKGLVNEFLVACGLCHFSHVWLFATLWTVICQVSLSMGFFRQEYWSGLPCPPQGIFLTQGLNLHLLCLLHWQLGSLPLGPPGKPIWEARDSVSPNFWLKNDLALFILQGLDPLTTIY